MHRSGTSAVTRVCNLLGADLGRRLMPAQADNTRGFWEHSELHAVHDELFACLGYTWDDARKLPDSWWSSERIRPYKHRIIGILQRDFKDVVLACVKDPRLSRLAPFWIDLLSEIGWQPCFLHVIRDPFAIADSLKSRNGFSIAKSHYMTIRHWLEAESATRGKIRAYVSYEQLLNNWRKTMRPVWDRLGLSWSREDRATDPDIREFLSVELRHHKGKASSNGKLDVMATRLYKPS